MARIELVAFLLAIPVCLKDSTALPRLLPAPSVTWRTARALDLRKTSPQSASLRADCYYLVQLLITLV